MKTLLLSLLVSLITTISTGNTLQVGMQRTVHIVCPMGVSHVSVGDYSLVEVQVVPEYPQVVRIKALQEFQISSSLSIYCQDSLYVIDIVYKEDASLYHHLSEFMGSVLGKQGSLNLQNHEISTCMQMLKEKPIHKPIRKEKQNGITFSLLDVSVKQDILFVRLAIQNESNLCYYLDEMQCTVRDKYRKKMSNVQEFPIQPVSTLETRSCLQANEGAIIILAFKGFSLHEKRYLELIQYERNSTYNGRNMTITLKNKDLIKAQKL